MSNTTTTSINPALHLPRSAPKQFTFLLLGDLQLGRLIDALLPTSISRLSPDTEPESAAETVDKYFLPRHPELFRYNYASPWGNWLSMIGGRGKLGVDVVLANLETAFTVSERKWEGKVFNYRSHPGNVRVLLEAGFGACAPPREHDDELTPRDMEGEGKRKRLSGYVSLANNHTLDWGVEGLYETVRTLDDAGVAFAGAGRDAAEAAAPAILILGDAEKGEREWEVRCWSFSDHPSDWKLPEFNLIDYTPQSREFMRRQIMAQHSSHNSGHDRKMGLKVVSLHWGPNYRWRPSHEQIELAHWLIDECEIDIIHGHSAHHIQGAEVYNGKLVLYGCGDFVDDYAVVSGGWRNDLSAAWKATVSEPETSADEHEELLDQRVEERKEEALRERGRLKIKTLEVLPNRITLFQAHKLDPSDEDHDWVQRKFRELCGELGTKVEEGLGEGGGLLVNVGGQ